MSYYPPLRIPLVDTRLGSVQTFTMSAAATEYQAVRAQFNPTGTSLTTYTPAIPGTDPVLSNLDTGLILHEGDKTDFDQQYLIKPPINAVVDQIAISAAFAANVSTYVDGALKLTHVKVNVNSYASASAPLGAGIDRLELNPATAFTALSAAGTHLFIVRHIIDIPIDVRTGGALIIQFQIGKSGQSTNDTYQLGIVDTYKIYKSTASQRMFGSELLVHLSPKPAGAEQFG